MIRLTSPVSFMVTPCKTNPMPSTVDGTPEKNNFPRFQRSGMKLRLNHKWGKISNVKGQFIAAFQLLRIVFNNRISIDEEFMLWNKPVRKQGKHCIGRKKTPAVSPPVTMQMPIRHDEYHLQYSSEFTRCDPRTSTICRFY